MKKFSIIIPAYNVEKYLRECIESIISQQYNNYEIIIVNDGSTDDTLKVIKNYQKQSNKIICINQKNSGAYLARINGVKEASGEYILFVDSDDILSNSSLQTLHNYIEKYRPEILKFQLSTDISIIDNTYLNNKATIYTKENKKELYKKFIEGHELNSLCIQAVKKELFSNIKIENKVLSRGEDALLNYELYTAADKVVIVNDVLYYYRNNPSSTTKTYDKNKIIKNIEDIFYVYQLKDNYLKKWDLLTNETNKMITNRLLNFLLSSLIKMIKSSNSNYNDNKKLLDYIYNNKVFNEIVYRTKYKDLNNKNHIKKIGFKLLYRKRYIIVLLLYPIKYIKKKEK